MLVRKHQTFVINNIGIIFKLFHRDISGPEEKSQKQQETWQYVVQSPPSELQRGRVRTAAINLFVFVKLIHSKRFFPSFSSLFHSLCPSSICPDNECLLRLPGIFSR